MNICLCSRLFSKSRCKSVILRELLVRFFFVSQLEKTMLPNWIFRVMKESELKNLIGRLASYSLDNIYMGFFLKSLQDVLGFAGNVLWRAFSFLVCFVYRSYNMQFDTQWMFYFLRYLKQSFQ